jgi:hypothetical protein
MKKLIYLIAFLGLFSSCAQLNPQSKKITEKFFPEYDQLENSTPALQKKKGYTDYEELIAFIEKHEKSYPDKVTISYLGESQKGKQIPLVKITNPNGAEKIKVWAQGGLHGNEPGSTESMLYLINKLLTDTDYSYLLDRVEIAIVPMANIDGYVKGSRYAANGLDLNRDQTKLMAQETVYLKQAFSQFNPSIGMDFHEYKPYRKDFARMSSFGITSYYDAMFLFSGNLNVPENLRKTTENLFVANARQLLEDNQLTYHDYISTGSYRGETHFNQGSNSARSSATSFALNNCISTLFEIRGVGIGRTSFKRRIYTSFLLAISYLKTAYENMETVKSEIDIAVQSQHDVIPMIQKKIYKDSIQAIDLDTREVITMQVTLRDALQLTPTLSRKRPKAYLIEASENVLIEKLKALGVIVEFFNEEKLLEVETYTVTNYNRNAKKYEKMNRQTVTTKVMTQSMTFPKGTYIISMDQQRSNLVAEILEPEGSNSFISFGVLKTDNGKLLPIYRIIK